VTFEAGMRSSTRTSGRHRPAARRRKVRSCQSATKEKTRQELRKRWEEALRGMQDEVDSVSDVTNRMIQRL